MEEYVGRTLEHRHFGKCKVLRVVNELDQSVRVHITKTKEHKTIILSAKHFKNVYLKYPQTKYRVSIFYEDQEEKSSNSDEKLMPPSNDPYYDYEVDTTIDFGYKEDEE